MYAIGEQVQLRFTTQAPSAILWLQLPDGQAATVDAPTRVDEDLVASYVPAVPGRYTYRCVASSGEAWQDVFNVRPARSLALCSLAGAKQHLNMEAQRRVDDQELRGHIEAATAVIERHRNEVVAARELTATVRAGSLVPCGPVVRAISAVRAGTGEAVDVMAWVSDPTTGLLSVPMSAGRDVTVTYLAGYPVVPESFVRAAEIIAAHLWETQRMSSIGGPSTVGDDQYLTPSGLGYAIPNRAVQLLGGRPPVVA